MNQYIISMTPEERKIVAEEAAALEELSKTSSYEKYIEFAKNLIKQHPLSYFSIIKGSRFEMLWRDICDKTSFLDSKFSPNAATRIFYYIYKCSSLKTCETCGKDITKDISPVNVPEHFFCCNRCAQRHMSTIEKSRSTKLKNHGDPNYNNMEKNRRTCKAKYGVEFSFQADEVKQKAKDTLVKKLGVDHQMRSSIVTDAMKARYRAKHGVDYTFSDPAVKEKIKSTNRAKFGVDWPMQNKDLKAQMTASSARSHRVNFFKNKLCNDPLYEPMFTVDEWLAHGREDNDHEFTWRCKTCDKVFKSRVMWGAATYVRCYDCWPVVKSTSKLEADIAEYIRSLGSFEVLNHVPETKTLIPPKEIDIVVKNSSGDIVLGVEVDGLYWHSAANGCDRTYHLSKTESCLEKGLKLVHVFEDEWSLKKDITKSRLASLLGRYEKRVFARKCEVRHVSSKESKKFFDENHLQGSCACKAAFGLFYEDEPVAMMSFGKRRRMMSGKNEEGSWELLRFACRCGVDVVGGASRLLKHFEREMSPKKLVSYADRRWSQGKLYYALGFKLDHTSAPSWWYLDSTFSKRVYRYAFRKSRQKTLLEKFDPKMNELENMAANGWSWIWDCGNYVFCKDYELLSK